MACTDHGPDVVCDREGRTTDGAGFPHRSELRPGQRACIHCHACDRLLERLEVRWSTIRGARVKPFCGECFEPEAAA